jgi:hypothetical protein
MMSIRPNPLLLPEIVGLVVKKVERVSDLSNCARVNKTWYVAALRELYRGSLNDMQFRTPDIGSLNCLLVASQARFSQNMGLVKHLLLSPEVPIVDEGAHPDSRLACIQKCPAIRNRHYAELLLQPKGSGLASLTIPFRR